MVSQSYKECNWLKFFAKEWPATYIKKATSVAVYLAGAQLAPANGIISFVFPTNKLLPQHIALFIVFLCTNSRVYNLYLLTLDWND